MLVCNLQVAAEALQALAAESEKMRPKIATANAIKPLLQMLQIGEQTATAVKPMQAQGPLLTQMQATYSSRRQVASNGSLCFHGADNLQQPATQVHQ